MTNKITGKTKNHRNLIALSETYSSPIGIPKVIPKESKMIKTCSIFDNKMFDLLGFTYVSKRFGKFKELSRFHHYVFHFCLKRLLDLSENWKIEYTCFQNLEVLYFRTFCTFLMSRKLRDVKIKWYEMNRDCFLIILTWSTQSPSFSKLHRLY